MLKKPLEEEVKEIRLLSKGLIIITLSPNEISDETLIALNKGVNSIGDSDIIRLDTEHTNNN